MKKFLFLFSLLTSLSAGAQANVYGFCADLNGSLGVAKVNKIDLPTLRMILRPAASCNSPILEQYVLAHPPALTLTPAQEQAMAQQLLTYVEQVRQDQQVGATAGSTGTTSLVSKGVGALVGVALESGSIDRTTSGNVTTVTANLAQGVDFLSAGQIQPCAVIQTNADCGFGRSLLTAVTVSSTFDVSQANTSTNSTPADTALATLVGSNAPAFTGITARADFHARKKAGTVALKDLVAVYQAPDYQALEAAYATAFSAFISSVEGDVGYQKALTDTLSELTNPGVIKTDSDVAAEVQRFVVKVANIINASAPMTAALQTYATAEHAYHGGRDAALSAVLNKWTASFEYDYNRLANEPDQSAFKFIYSYRSDPGTDRILQVTANGGTTIYDSLLGSSTSRVRSAQAAFQLDYTATHSTSNVQAAVSGGYYFQYMNADGLLTLPAAQLAPGTAIALPGGASELLNTTGPIHIGQGKLTLSMKGTSISIPLALTFSNRTDLIMATKVGGNFGITYDFSSLFAAIKQ